MGFKTNTALFALILAVAGCGKAPKNVIAEWEDKDTKAHYSVEAPSEKARRVTRTTRDSTAVLYGDGEGDDPDTVEMTVNGNPSSYGGEGQPPLLPSAKSTFEKAVTEAAERADATLKGPEPTPAPAAPTPEPNVLYGPKPLGDADNVTLESLSDGTGKLTLTKGDLTWVLYDKDGDMVPETGERTVGSGKPGYFGGTTGKPELPSQAERLYKDTVEAIRKVLGEELDALYPAAPAPAVAPVPAAAPAPGPAAPVVPSGPAAPAPGHVQLEQVLDYTA